MNYTDYYAYLLTEMGIAESNEIDLVTDILGMNTDSLDSILYARTGHRTLCQYFEEVIVPHDYHLYDLNMLGLEHLLEDEDE